MHMYVYGCRNVQMKGTSCRLLETVEDAVPFKPQALVKDMAGHDLLACRYGLTVGRHVAVVATHPAQHTAILIASHRNAHQLQLQGHRVPMMRMHSCIPATHHPQLK